MMRGRGEGGQAVPLMVAVMAVGLVFLLGIARLAAGAVHAARARTAADAAALAGAQWGRGAAVAAAADNGGRLRWFEQRGLDVLVTVEVDGATADARATVTISDRGP